MCIRDRFKATKDLISVVDDDEAIRRTTTLLIESFGFRATAFESAESFLKSGQLHDTSCLILDVQMPDMNGFELQSELAAAGYSIPTVSYTHLEVSFGELTSDGHKVFTGFIRDISERKQAEDRLRASERNLQTTQAELARVSRLTTMGELAASIAHEVNQPLTAVINNGSACLRLLANNNLEPEVLRRALEGIIADGTRASTVLARIRAFIKKEPAEKSELDINEVIQEVLVLAGRELYENQVLPDHQLKTDLPSVLAAVSYTHL